MKGVMLIVSRSSLLLTLSDSSVSLEAIHLDFLL